MFVCEGEQTRMEGKKNTARSPKTDSKRDSSAKVDIYGTEDLFFFIFYFFLLDSLKILAQKLL